MKFNKEEFLKTELGQMMKECVRDGVAFCDIITDGGKQKAKFINEGKWEACCTAVRQFYGIECHFTKQGDYSGITFEDKNNWLFKIDRHTGEEITETTLDTSEPQEGLAEIEALPIFEHKPQMPEEKKKLVGLLMGFVETAICADVSGEWTDILPDMSKVLASLVN